MAAPVGMVFLPCGDIGLYLLSVLTIYLVVVGFPVAIGPIMIKAGIILHTAHTICSITRSLLVEKFGKHDIAAKQ